MRSLEYLLQLYPDKTGNEILAIQEQDKKDDIAKQMERDKAKLEIIKDIKENGGFFKGRFGMDQRFYYKILDIKLDERSNIYVDVESIVVFLGNEIDVVKPGDVRIEKRVKEFGKYDQYAFEMYERITEEDYKKLDDYLYNIAQFWDEVK